MLGGNFQRGVFIGGNIHRGYFHRGKFSVGQFPGGQFLGGNFPDTSKNKPFFKSQKSLIEPLQSK